MTQRAKPPEMPTSPHQRQTRPHCQKAARAGGVYLTGQIGLVGQSLAQLGVLLLQCPDLAVEVSDQERQ